MAYILKYKKKKNLHSVKLTSQLQLSVNDAVDMFWPKTICNTVSHLQADQDGACLTAKGGWEFVS